MYTSVWCQPMRITSVTNFSFAITSPVFFRNYSKLGWNLKSEPSGGAGFKNRQYVCIVEFNIPLDTV